jgi:hypothetical protein
LLESVAKFKYMGDNIDKSEWHSWWNQE